MSELDIQQQSRIAAVRFTKVGKLYYFDCQKFDEVHPGDYVIADTARGRYMGQVIGFVDEIDPAEEYRPLLRTATPRDMLLAQHWQSQQDDALVVCRENAQGLDGFDDVKFIAAQYNYDGTSLTFLFTAEQKVNVHPLWDKLKRIFPAQIEMRQIGPRDVAKLLGGYGACGELRCCSTFLTDFSPISIKMAKTQGISLNPSEITGMCGRLRCCLIYEYEQYVAALKQLPRRNKRVGTPHGIGKVVDVHPLQDAVTVHIEDEGQYLVQREELIPLEEYEAFVKKAQEGCQREEPCACGAPRPAEAAPDELSREAGDRTGEDRQYRRDRAPKPPKHASSEHPEGDEKRSQHDKRSRRRRDKRRSGRKRDQSQNQDKNQARKNNDR